MYDIRSVKRVNWNSKKNMELKESRNITFEDVLFYLEKNLIIDIVENPNQDKYPGQKYYIIEINDYIYYVPFVENDEEVFLKTIIPSRKYTKKYSGGIQNG